MFALILIACGALTGAADATKAGHPVHCALNYAQAVPCRMSDRVGSDGIHSMRFVFGARRVRFTGKSQTGWWSGQLDGQPAMGYERNRGHVVFSTVDLKTSFEWWSEGNEHGTY